MLGIVGKPNAGKSTFFMASTGIDVETANYPFTTIDSNRGYAYIREPCPCQELDITCNPQNSRCIDGTRHVPIELLDVAGLVPDAYKGKGLGNEFLDQLRQADALIHVIDSSGSTDQKGNPVEISQHDPTEDIDFLTNEIKMWMLSIIEDKWSSLIRRVEVQKKDLSHEIHDVYTGLGLTLNDIKMSISKLDLNQNKPSNWSEKDRENLIENMRRESKPILIAANKADIAPKENIEKIKETKQKVVPTSASAELALKKASQNKIIDYRPGDTDYKILEPEKLSEKQKKGLEFIKKEVLHKYGGTGVQETIEKSVRDLLNQIVVYPVEDENNYTDKNDNVLPDAILLEKGSTPKDLAYKIHSDIGNNYLYAVNAKTDMRISEEEKLQNGDIIKIVSST
ncbi:redox-regulated ATPase YchF [Methanonatronarchaeum sp. AMET-Sl]|uniref:redox-regulated ATPase YchF n=1 Tax=Methanonatronarchaeum sp. AMET-Sl TaxID=3037654 RepID=UPI0032666FA8